MTELLYPVDTDSGYVRRFTARVEALPPGAVVLDRTFFYPGGGGQPPDRGLLHLADAAPIGIADVSRTSGTVLHRVARGRGPNARPARVGETIEGEIDWDRRFRHMRLHTAQHLASALLFSRAGLRTRKATLGGSEATIDLEGTAPDVGEGAAWVEEFREIVRAGRPVRVRHLPRAEYERSPSPRSGLIALPPGIEEVRVIEIDGADASPCGGTHLRSTGEIGGVRFHRPSGAQPERVHLTVEEPTGGAPTPPA